VQTGLINAGASGRHCRSRCTPLGAASRITHALRCHPTFFFSGALFPVPDLPGPVRLNPLSYGLDGLRGALSGSFAFGAATDLAVLGSLAVCCLGSALIYSRTSRCNDG
jgi:hypothetical protein